MTLRGRIGALAGRVIPGLDERVFTRDRDRVLREAVASGGYDAALADLPVSSRTAGDRPAHLVVIPEIGPDAPSWQAAGGNFLFEVAQGAREQYGEDQVSIFAVGADEEPAAWHVRLIRHLVETGATHVMAQVESDPNSAKQRYSWDVLWSQLHTRWDGVLLGLVTDSYFTWITAAARRLARMSPRFVLVDICMPMDGVLIPGRVEVGPVNMPVSNASLTLIDAHCAGAERVHDVSFIGTLYPYRVELLEAIRATGASVAVNPHRQAPSALAGAAGAAVMPSYPDYMKALAQSRITINFSQANAGRQQQLKTRVLEATAMGALVLTDDVDRTDRFWVPGEEYGTFTDAASLPGVVEAWLDDPERLDRVRLAGQARARRINVSSFWGGVDTTLGARGLPGIRRSG